MKCISCHENLLSEDNFTKFRCPQCLKAEVARCIRCRRKSNVYICPDCGLEGP